MGLDDFIKCLGQANTSDKVSNSGDSMPITDTSVDQRKLLLDNYEKEKNYF